MARNNKMYNKHTFSHICEHQDKLFFEEAGKYARARTRHKRQGHIILRINITLSTLFVCLYAARYIPYLIICRRIERSNKKDKTPWFVDVATLIIRPSVNVWLRCQKCREFHTSCVGQTRHHQTLPPPPPSPFSPFSPEISWNDYRIRLLYDQQTLSTL